MFIKVLNFSMHLQGLPASIFSKFCGLSFWWFIWFRKSNSYGIKTLNFVISYFRFYYYFKNNLNNVFSVAGFHV